MPEHGGKTGHDTLSAILARLQRLEDKRPNKRTTWDRGDHLKIANPVEGQVIVQYDTEEVWYFSNGEWRLIGGGTMMAPTAQVYNAVDLWQAGGQHGNDWELVADAGAPGGYVVQRVSGASPADPDNEFFAIGFLADTFNNGIDINILGYYDGDQGELKGAFGGAGLDAGAFAATRFVPLSGWFDFTGRYYTLGSNVLSDRYAGAPAWDDPQNFGITAQAQIPFITQPAVNKPGTTYVQSSGSSTWDGGPGMYALKLYVDSKHASSSGYDAKIWQVSFTFCREGEQLGPNP